MIGLFVSDLHANLRLPMAKVDPGGVSSDRLRDVVSILEQIRDYAFNRSPRADFVAILGDLFDQSHPDGATLIAVSRVLADLADRVPTMILPGNHDAVDRDGRLYSLQFYGELRVPRLRVLGHETVKAGAVGGTNVFLHAVPWLPEERARKRIRARAGELKTGTVDVLMFHQGIRGALWDSGRSSDDGLDADIADRFDLALTGHYHRPQKFGRNGYYLGSPLDIRFGDEAVEERGFWEVEFGKRTITPKLIPTKYPRFQTLHVTYLEGDVDLKSVDLRAGINPGVEYLRIVVSGTAAQIDADREVIRSWQASVAEWGLRALKIDERPIQEGKVRLEADANLSLSELTALYAQQFAPEGVDPLALAEEGIRFLEGS